LEPKRKTAVKSGIETASLTGSGSARWTCRVISGNDSGKEALLGKGTLLLGADPRCGLVLNDSAVSGKHAEIRATAEGISIRDLGSTNGTFYRSSKIGEVVINSTATITVGSTKLEITPWQRMVAPVSERSRFGGLIGSSIAMREVFGVLELASPTDATVLIEGESGTGKELAARAVHDHSKRAEKPFVVMDCCATKEQLIESQLFGHVAGAFTGAVRNRRGAFLEANGGTLFLDELGELPLGSQGKLLRALEAHTIQPVGSDRTIKVDVRVIAATNRDLYKMVEEKTFRFDLFHRLSVVHFQMPALRDHLEDMTVLIKYFYEGRDVPPGPIGGDNLRRLCRYDWPGNVRELRNVLERSLVLAGPSGGAFSDLQLQIGASAAKSPSPGVDTGISFKDAKELWNDLFESQYIAALFAEHDGNISKAAEHAGINRNHFRKLLIKHDILK
jgi:transcriptional regulator with GAF, ATPase, and Fis domain